MSINREAPFFLEVSRGRIEAHSSEFKFSRSTLVGAAESIVWDGGGNYTFLDNAEIMSVVSTSVEDAVGGTGASSIVIYGLDENKLPISEVLTMTGTTPKLTQLSYIRVYRMLALMSGTNDPINDANKGIITLSAPTAAVDLAIMQINNGQTLMSPYTIPAGYTGYITGVSFSAGQGKQCLFKAKFRNGPTNDFAFSIKFTIDLYQNYFYGLLVAPLRVPEMTDIVITAQTTSGTIEASASYGLILIKNK